MLYNIQHNILPLISTFQNPQAGPGFRYSHIFPYISETINGHSLDSHQAGVPVGGYERRIKEASAIYARKFHTDDVNYKLTTVSLNYSYEPHTINVLTFPIH